MLIFFSSYFGNRYADISLLRFKNLAILANIAEMTVAIPSPFDQNFPVG